MDVKTEDKNIVKKLKLKTAIEALFAIIFVFLLGMGLIAYFFSPSEYSLAGRILKTFSYPVVSIEGNNFIFTSQVRESLGVLKKYYESKEVSVSGNRVDFSSDEGQKRLKLKEKEVLNREIENKAIEIIAKKRGIILSQKEIDEYYNWKVAGESFLGKDFNSFVSTYGWNDQKIKEKIIIPLLYSDKLSAQLAEDFKKSDEGEKIIELAKKELEGGADFAEIAKKYSQGSSAQSEGSLGWISKEQIVPEVSRKIFSADNKTEEKYEIIESSIGYHIIKIEEMKKEEGVDMARISQIFTRKKTFGEWLSNELKTMEIKLFVKEYYWNKDKSSIEFSQEDMKSFEEKVYEDNVGDVSVSEKIKL